MPYKILYIDDEEEQRSQTYADGLSGLGLVAITIDKPTSYEKLINELVEKQDLFDALILDLKLDGNQNGDRIATYTAPSLAAGIRSKCFNDDGFKNEFPIFLLSSSENLKKYYDPDSSSHDLFDYTITKTSIGESGANHERRIASIIEAYQIINENKTDFAKILGVPSIDQVDDRIFTSRFLTGEDTSVSEVSQFIFNEVLAKSGVLISQDILASRLGIDYRSSEDWKMILELLNDAKYSGIFCRSFNRWWAVDFMKWWNLNFDNIPLIRLDALERVKLISEKFNLKYILAATKIDKTTSTKFWTICEAYELPLDTKDGFLIDGNQIYPWHDKRYLSLESILERDAIDKGFRIHPVEKERFEDLKKEYL
ncbi:MAG: hypothetical protein ACYC25_02055 [Paludibacter sp.]